MMTRSILLAAALCGTGFFVPNAATAQAGPFIDWIHKLSGPRFFWQWGGRLTTGYQHGVPVKRSTLDELRDSVDSLRGKTGELSVREQAWKSAFDRSGACQARLALLVDSLSESVMYRARTVDNLDRDASRLVNDLKELSRPGARLRFSETEAAEVFCSVGATMGRLATLRPLVVPDHGMAATLSSYWKTNEDGVSIWTTQLTLEYVLPPVYLPVRVNGKHVPLQFSAEAGVARHRFGGVLTRSFDHWSSPLLLNWYPLPKAIRPLRPLRATAGYIIFRPFDADDFAPLEPLDPPNVVEIVPTFAVVYDDVIDLGRWIASLF